MTTAVLEGHSSVDSKELTFRHQCGIQDGDVGQTEADLQAQGVAGIDRAVNDIFWSNVNAGQ